VNRERPRPASTAAILRTLLPAVLVLAATASALAQQAAGQTAPPPTAESERERWNRAFTLKPPNIRTDATQFLVQVAANLKPGTAIDVGMGFGRNALHLARTGWTVTGVDLSDVGVQRAQEQAQKEKLPLTAIRGDALQFDYGRDKWDLVAAMYMGRVATDLADRLTDALKPGGVLVIEHFLRKPEERLGYLPGELPKAFGRLEVLRYAEEDARPDYDQQNDRRVVRFLARKRPN
jgi:SAM-dependent methyltransferase